MTGVTSQICKVTPGGGVGDGEADARDSDADGHAHAPPTPTPPLADCTPPPPLPQPLNDKPVVHVKNRSRFFCSDVGFPGAEKPVLEIEDRSASLEFSESSQVDRLFSS